MNTQRSTRSIRKFAARALLAAAAMIGAGALFSPASARADTRVGVSVGIGLPRGAAEIHVGRDRYYSHRGVFYRRGPHGYVVVPAPRGAVVHVLPPRYTRIYVGGTEYYRYGDVYYRPVRGGYVVVDAPVVPVAAAPLPPVPPVQQQYQSVWVGMKEFLFKDGQFFVKTPEGLTWVPAPVGAITKDLPTDVQSVWYQGIEYFESDDVFFRKTPDGYQVVLAPWKGVTTIPVQTTQIGVDNPIGVQPPAPGTVPAPIGSAPIGSAPIGSPPIGSTPVVVPSPGP